MNKKIDWPSERVAQGGLFHPHKVAYSKDTHDLIKLLMEEQKMTMFQRNKVNYYLRNGDPLPIPKQTPIQRKIDYEDRLAYEIMMRAKSARKRTFDEIKASGAFKIEKYIPIHHLRESNEKQKLRLQEHLSGIKEHPELDGINIKNKYKFKRTNKSKSGDADNLDPIDQLLNEITERADWLAEMDELGEGGKHRNVIHGQIAERLRMIKKIENNRQQAATNNTLATNINNSTK